ncbi:MAG: hypothetical protein NT051_06910, partial [Candidatus Micrarchaeota archaeon]|nr:hypothetical protein [Candidatus Micrarchaeota archaeon]
MGNASKLLLAFIILGQLCFSLWTQSINVSIHDLSGLPLENAMVRISYQKSSALFDTSTGKTDSNGVFTALISNSAPSGSAIDHFNVSASAAYWPGEARSIPVNESGYSSVDFTAPFSLAQVTVNVTDTEGKPIENASVYLIEANSKKASDWQGIALFLLPQNHSFRGLVVYKNASKSFSNSDAASYGKNRSVSIRLTIKNQPLPSSPELSLNVKVLGLGGQPIASQAVIYSCGGESTSAQTDSNGAFVLKLNKSCTLNLTVQKNDYAYKFSFNITVAPEPLFQKSEISAAIWPLLSISTFQSKEESTNCFALLANVSDSRKNLPLEVRMIRQMLSFDLNKSLEIQLPLALSDDGRYVSRLCIKSNTPVTVFASNKYESIQRSLDLSYSPPRPPSPIVTATVVSPINPEEEKARDAALS